MDGLADSITCSRSCDSVRPGCVRRGSSQGEVIQDLISLYKSLGGGWAPNDADETAAEETAGLEKTELKKREATD